MHIVELISRATEIHLPCVCDRDLSAEEVKVKKQEWNTTKLQIQEMEKELEVMERKKREKEEEYGTDNIKKVITSNDFTILSTINRSCKTFETTVCLETEFTIDIMNIIENCMMFRLTHRQKQLQQLQQHLSTFQSRLHRLSCQLSSLPPPSSSSLLSELHISQADAQALVEISV